MLRKLSRAPVRIVAVCVAAAFLFVSQTPIGPEPAGAQTTVRKGKKPPPKQRKKPPPKQVEAPKPPVRLERIPFTAAEQAAALALGSAGIRAWGDSAKDFARLLPTMTGPWLALSGGGADGAFSAGLLAGLTQAGKRPEFAVVSGVSIGALIAPYVFLGSKYDAELHKLIIETTAADVFEDRGTPESLFDYWPLKRAIERRVTEKMLAEIAVEHKRGRRLWVTTTSLDTGRPVVWNMGAIAERGGEDALKLFRSVLLASSAIPGFFAPVSIEVEANGKKFQEMHNDGTLTAPFYIAPEAMLASGNPRLPANELYVIVNGKLAADFGPPGRSTVEILGRSISVALTFGLRTELALVVAAARRQSLVLRYAHIDPRFTKEPRGVFDGEYMKALFDFAAEQAKNGIAFQVVTAAGVRTDGK